MNTMLTDETTDPEAPERRNSLAMVAAVAVRALVGALAGLAVSLVVSALVGRPIPFVIYLLLAIGLIVRLGLALLEWRNTTYQIRDTELIYRTGGIQSTAMNVPWSSIRGIQAESPWLLRMLGNSDVRISHGAGTETDIHLKSLTPASVDALREQIIGARLKGVDKLEFSNDAEDFTRARISLYALSHSRWYVVIPFLLAAMGLLSQFLQKDIIETVAVVWNSLYSLGMAETIAIVVATGLLSTGMGIIARAVEMSNFRVNESPEHIETRQGLISTRVRTIAHKDITVFEQREPLMYRLMNRRVVLMSGGSGEGEPAMLLSPDASPTEAASIAERFFPDEHGRTLIARTRLTGQLLTVIVWAVLLFVAQSLIDTLWSPWAAAGVLMVVVLTLVRSRSCLLLSPDGTIEVRRGVWPRRRLILRTASILHYSAVRSPLGRWVPSNRIRITIADRGTRDLSVGSLALSDMTEAMRMFAEQPQIGTYRYARVIMHDDAATEPVGS